MLAKTEVLFIVLSLVLRAQIMTKGPRRVLRLTFDMSSGRRQAQLAGGRPLDGRVRRHLARDLRVLDVWHARPQTHPNTRKLPLPA